MSTLKYDHKRPGILTGYQAAPIQIEQDIYVRAQQEQQEISVYLSDKNTTPICEQRIYERYEHIDREESFSVYHPVRN
jgi:hypothetical protein